MADTAFTIITDALLDIGVLADEEVPTASQAAGALRKLNNMIDSWNIDGLLVYGATQYVVPLVANQQVYTIGVGGNLNVARPANITAAYIRDTYLTPANRVDTPLYMFNDTEWANLPMKGMTGTYPNYGVWFDEGFPLIKAYVSPIPTGSQYSLVFWASTNLNNLLLNDVISLAPGYKRAITSNLCLELEGSYGVQTPPSIQRIAQSSKASLKRKNLQINELDTGSYSYYDYRINRLV